MKNTSVLIDNLKDFNYYIRKIPLYLQNDENFISHFKIWYDFLITQVNNGDILLDLFDIYSDDYIEKINTYGEFFLDYLASLFNIRRSFSIRYIGMDGKEHLDAITLTNEELLLFVKARIIKNYSNGSYGQMREFYEKNNLTIFLKWTDSNPAIARVYLLDIPGIETSNTENIKKLFLAGLLNIESMGISYLYSIQEYSKFFIWDKEESEDYTGWDYGEWVL